MLLGLFPALFPIVIGCFPVPLSVPGPILFVLHPRENGVTETTISNSSQYRCFSNKLLFLPSVLPSVTISGPLLEPLISGSNQPRSSQLSRNQPMLPVPRSNQLSRNQTMLFAPSSNSNSNSNSNLHL